MEIYLDNGATTKVSQVAVDKILDCCSKNYGNPSSLHKMGLLAHKEIVNNKKIISNYLQVDESEIFFTSGATEANNLIIKGIADAYKRDGKHLITNKSEHPSVLQVYIELEKQGYDIDYVNIDDNGNLDINMLESLIREDTILVSIMEVNNETGVIHPINDIGKIIKKINPTTIFHVDGVQSFCKLPSNIKSGKVDAYSFSGHKIYSPKGVGGFYLKKGIKITAQLIGGHQQKDVRPGTENIIGIAAIGSNVDVLAKNISKNYDTVKKLKESLLEIKNEFSDIYINGSDNCSPYILNLSFVGLRGEVLVHALEQDNIYASTGSACNSKSKDGMLYSYGLDDERVLSAVRFSFSIHNSIEEIEFCKNSLRKNIPILRKYGRR